VGQPGGWLIYMARKILGLKDNFSHDLPENENRKIK
jgi:hypothetical protein